MTNPAAPLFTHLHVHSEYSLLDGTIVIKDLVKRAKAMGHTHIALTDHGNMHGAIEFYTAAKSAGITPILGVEIYCEGGFHLVLLAKNSQGYKNLLKIVSSGYLGEQLKDVPIVPKSALAAYGSDLVALSGCLKGELGALSQELRSLCGSGELIFGEDDDRLQEVYSSLKTHVHQMTSFFGTGNYYVELIDNNLPGQRTKLEDLVAVARHFGLPLVATADAHYMDEDFRDLHAMAIAIKNSLTMGDIRGRLRNTRFHLTTSDEMQELFEEWPEALRNSNKIAAECSFVEIQMNKYFLPKIDLGTTETPDEALRRLSREGLLARFEILDPLYGPTFDETKKKEYWDRLDFELTVIIQMGFADYFLIVQDFIGWAKKQSIPVGPGRGSGAGSLVAYALKITDLDPIPYTLIFERFLNPERVSMPDFDVDFCQWRRDEVIQYCIQKYGADQVAQITTFGKMQAKGAVKSVGRAMNLGYNRVDQFTKLFPKDIGITLQDALKQEPRLTQEMDKDESLKECMEYALKLEGLSSHTSVHAAGLVISDGPMVNYVPIYTTDGKGLVTQYEMKPAEKVGLVKFDFLGLKTLTVIDKAVSLLRRSKAPNFSIERIPLDDPKVFQNISEGNTVGIFQCESQGMTQLIKKLKPSTFEDIIALVALFRPGPLGSGMVDDFVERKHGRQAIVYLHPSLESILKDTYGMILYQEQVQKIAAILAKYSLGEADLLRRAMGKKIPEEMAKQKDRFISGALDNQVDPKVADQIFDLMAEFANYGFNKSHSAAYGLVSYQTAYLKTHFPEEFLAASLTCDLDNTDKVKRYIEDCHRLKIKVLLPNINRSSMEFEVPKDRHIDFALAAIKGMGQSALLPILEERARGGAFANVEDLARRVHLGKVGKKNLQTLVEGGALDLFGYERKKLIALIDEVVGFSSTLHENKSSGVRSLFDLMSDSTNAPKGPKPHWAEHVPEFDQNKKYWDYSDLITEKKLLGVFLSDHPLSLFKPDCDAFSRMKIRDFAKALPMEKKEGKRKRVQVSLIAFLSLMNMKRTQKGNLMASLRLEDEGDAIEAVMFENQLKASKVPPMGTVVLAIGNIERGFDGESIRFTLEHIEAIQDFRPKRVGEVELTIQANPAQTEAELLNRLTKLIRHTTKEGPGSQIPIKFLLDYGQVKLRIAPAELKVDLSDQFICGLSGFPQNSVKCFYRLRGPAD